jgi:hypothetical protein
MITEMYRCMVDELLLNFKESVHDIIYKIERDDDVNDIDRELFMLHIEDIYDSIREVL